MQDFQIGSDARIPRHHDDVCIRVRRERPLQEIHSRHDAHIQIEQYDVELSTAEDLPRLVTAANGHDPVTFYLQNAGTSLPQRAVVIDDQNLE